jgi:amino-acid N-acetyltransferase
MFSSGVASSPMYNSKIKVVSGNFITAKPAGIKEGIDLQLESTNTKPYA